MRLGPGSRITWGAYQRGSTAWHSRKRGMMQSRTCSAKEMCMSQNGDLPAWAEGVHIFRSGGQLANLNRIDATAARGKMGGGHGG